LPNLIDADDDALRAEYAEVRMRAGGDLAFRCVDVDVAARKQRCRERIREI
jgi:hypothetical protein